MLLLLLLLFVTGKLQVKKFASDLDEIADKVGTIGIEEIITKVTSLLCYFIKTWAGSIQGVPFGYPDYIELAQYMINISLEELWWHVTARDQAHGYISTDTFPVWQAPSSLCCLSYTSRQTQKGLWRNWVCMQTQFSGGFS